jgi:hypothetical protein
MHFSARTFNVAIDISTERVVSMGQASAVLPGHPSLCTLWRWRLKGVRGRKLETVVIGGRPYTSVEALARFARQEGGAEAAPIRTPASREKAISRAERELADAGI